MGIREERRHERQTAVLDAAMQLIERDGFQAVTIAAVAAHIGASVGGMYRYFPTKKAIFVALQRRSIQAFKRFMMDNLRSAGQEGPLTRIRVAFESWPQFHRTHPQHFRLLDEFLSSPERALTDEQARAVQSELIELMNEIAQLLEDATEAGALSQGDSMARTHMLWAAIHGVQHFEKRDHLQPDSLKAEALRERIFQDFFTAWGPTLTSH